jgi:hypothetical protein
MDEDSDGRMKDLLLSDALSLTNRCCCLKPPRNPRCLEDDLRRWMTDNDILYIYRYLLGLQYQYMIDLGPLGRLVGG